MDGRLFIKGVVSQELKGYDRALLYDEFGQHKEAILIYREWLRNHPDDIFALNNLSYDYAFLNIKIEEAEQIARRVVSSVTHPQEKASALDTLAFVLLRKGKFEEAKTLLEESISLRLDKAPHPEHLFRYYVVLEKLGQTKEAFDYLARAYQFFVNDEILNPSSIVYK